jgi:hypothetical protein
VALHAALRPVRLLLLRRSPDPEESSSHPGRITKGFSADNRFCFGNTGMLRQHTGTTILDHESRYFTCQMVVSQAKKVPGAKPEKTFLC